LQFSAKHGNALGKLGNYNARLFSTQADTFVSIFKSYVPEITVMNGRQINVTHGKMKIMND